MSQVGNSRGSKASTWSNDDLERGMIDLYTRRMVAVARQREAASEAELERIVVTQPFGRAFTAQPSFPPDPPEGESTGLARLRQRLAGAGASPARGKLATS